MASGRKPSMLRINTRAGRGIGVAVGVNVGVGVSVCVGEGVMLGVVEGVTVAVEIILKPRLGSRQEVRNRSARLRVRIRFITNLSIDFYCNPSKLFISYPI